MTDIKQVKAKRTALSQTPPAKPAVAPPEPPVAPASPARRAQICAETFLTACQATFASIGPSQSAMASDVNALAREMTGLAQSNLTAAADSMAALLSAKSLTDAVEAQLGLPGIASTRSLMARPGSASSA